MTRNTKSLHERIDTLLKDERILCPDFILIVPITDELDYRRQVFPSRSNLPLDVTRPAGNCALEQKNLGYDSSLVRAQSARPAAAPEAQAHWKLNPPS
jgi:hypothetical protein